MWGPQTLLDYEDNWVTRIGKWFPGERVVIRGKDLHHDLKSLGWIELLLFAITGRAFTGAQVKLFEHMCTLSVSYPDPSIWPNRVAALAATARSTGLMGVGAAIAVQGARVFGGGPSITGMDMLIEMKRRVDEGAELAELVKRELEQRRGLPGFGRPVVRTDERLAPVMALARELGLADGPHLKLVLRVQEILNGLLGTWALQMNVSSLISALAADQGLSPRELYNFMIPAFSIGYVACFADAEQKPEGALFPLRCERIRYEGHSRRAWSAEGDAPQEEKKR